MSQIPPPSRNVIQSLMEAIAFCNKGEPAKAARELASSAQVIEVMPSMRSDLYHLANAVIKLDIESHVRHAGLLHVVNVVKNQQITLTGPSWVGNLYPVDEASGDEAADDDVEFDQPDPGGRQGLTGENLDHFTRDQLLRMGNQLLREGDQAFERRDPDGALDRYREAHDIATHLEHTDGVATCLFKMGYAIHARGDGRSAERHYRDALQLSELLEPSTRAAIGQYLFHAARYFELEGNPAKMTEYFQRALELFQEQGDQEGITACLAKLAGAP